MSHESTLTHSGAQLIYSTFVVTEAEAQDLARAYVGLIDAHGGDVSAFHTAGFQDLLIKELNKTLAWRDPKRKEAWERERRDQYEAFKQAMGVGRESPFKTRY